MNRPNRAVRPTAPTALNLSPSLSPAGGVCLPHHLDGHRPCRPDHARPPLAPIKHGNPSEVVPKLTDISPLQDHQVVPDPPACGALLTHRATVGAGRSAELRSPSRRAHSSPNVAALRVGLQNALRAGTIQRAQGRDRLAAGSAPELVFCALGAACAAPARAPEDLVWGVAATALFAARSSRACAGRRPGPAPGAPDPGAAPPGSGGAACPYRLGGAVPLAAAG